MDMVPPAESIPKIETAAPPITYRGPTPSKCFAGCLSGSSGARDPILVIAKLDRLAHYVAFISNLMESGVEFVACDMPVAQRPRSRGPRLVVLNSAGGG
jgi:hypothetical protein